MLSVRRDALTEKRKACSLTQHRLSLLSGLSGNAIHRMEQQNHKVSLLRAKAVADAMNCTVEELFYTSK